VNQASVNQNSLAPVSENRLMNRRICVWVGSILGGLSLAGFASGQTTPPPAAASIPPQALGAADETAYAAPIKQFITDQVTALIGADPAAATAARDKLKGAMTRGDSPAYYTALAKDWEAACTAELAKNPSVGVRLNFAIVTATLADNGQTPDAQPMVLKLLDDREPCVVVWAIKAARPLITVLATQPTAVASSPLPAAVVSAVKKCGKSDVSGYATSDAYTALAVKTIPGLAEPAVKPLRPPLAKFVLDIVEFRVQQHAEGLVQSPGAERDIATWLSGVYPDLTAAEKTRMVQLLVNLEANVGKRAALYPNNKKDLNQIREMLKYVSSALKVIGGTAVGSKLDWLCSIPPAATPENISQHTEQVFPTLQLVFHELTAPPAIPDIEPPTSASTKP
jgi:hypothetical protein